MLSFRSHLVTLLFLSLSILQQTSQNQFKPLVVNDVHPGSHLLSASVFYLKVIGGVIVRPVLILLIR